MIKKIKQNLGFTIIELIVVISIISLLSAFLIIYTKISNSQIILSLETAELVEMINKAKNLSLATYTKEGSACGYGIKIDYNLNSYSLFQYGNAPNCSGIASSTIENLNQNYVELSKKSLSKTSKFNQNSNYLNIIFFAPPDPQIFIWKNNNTQPIYTSNPRDGGAIIYLSTQDGSFKKEIKLNVYGQISY